MLILLFHRNQIILIWTCFEQSEVDIATHPCFTLTTPASMKSCFSVGHWRIKGAEQLSILAPVLAFTLYTTISLTPSLSVVEVSAALAHVSKHTYRRREGICLWRLVGGAIGGQAHCNGWNGINGTICLTLPFIPFTMSLSYSSSNQPPLVFIVLQSSPGETDTARTCAAKSSAYL